MKKIRYLFEYGHAGLWVCESEAGSCQDSAYQLYSKAQFSFIMPESEKTMNAEDTAEYDGYYWLIGFKKNLNCIKR